MFNYFQETFLNLLPLAKNKLQIIAYYLLLNLKKFHKFIVH